MRGDYNHLTKRVEEFFKVLVWGLVWLTLVTIVCAVVPACFGQEGYEVTLSTFECYSDARFLDDWETSTSAAIDLDLGKPELNRHDIEVWSEGLRVASYPASVKFIDVTGIVKPSFKIVNRLTLDRRTLAKSPYQSIASCQIMPPPDGAAWVWDEDAGRFELKVVVTTGPPVKVEMGWSYRVVEVDE